MKKYFIVLLGGVLMLIVVALYSESEVMCMVDPTGEYTAVVTYRKYEAIIPHSPGGSSDKSGYVVIYDRKGKSYGRIPIGMILMADDLEWTESGAMIPAYCEWNFNKGEYRYWNDSQTEEITRTIK